MYNVHVLIPLGFTAERTVSTCLSEFGIFNSVPNLRIWTFLGSKRPTSCWRFCSRPWILQDLLNTIPASISMPRKMSLACRERSESWWMMLVNVWQPTSSKDENNTGFRSLRLPGSSLGNQPSFGDSLLTRRGSTVLWSKGIFISHQRLRKMFAQVSRSVRSDPRRAARPQLGMCAGQ